VESRVSAILILGPVTLAYLIPFIKYVVANPQGTNEGGWHWLAYLTLYGVVLAYCFFLGHIIWDFAFGPKSYNDDELKLLLGGLETAFGGMIAIVFERLFGVTISKGNPGAEPAKTGA
jgi:hypothetical protein